MKYWEFLIQKEGDQTWLPLETAQVEILEGRYRVVAHTDRANTAMEIRVSQLITDELPPRRRTRKRIGQTNEAGLVVVMPFVHLKPGQWELACSGTGTGTSEHDLSESDLLQSDLLQQDWHYRVQLQVFAHTEEDWSGEWPIPEDAEILTSTFIETDGADIDPNLINPDLPLIQAQVALETHLQNREGHEYAPASDILPDEFGYDVTLRQQAYLAHYDQPMSIMGTVHSRVETVHEETSQLWIRLQNPETTQVIMEAHRPLSLARLPADFKVQIQLPAEVTTRVILGEVSLRTEALAPTENAKILASTAFTITAGIAQLLDSLANQDFGIFEEEEEAIFSGDSTSINRHPNNTSTEPLLPLTSPSVPSLNLGQTSFVPAVGVVFPPQIDHHDLPTEESQTYRQPELPNFAGQEADTAANLIVSAGSDTLYDNSRQIAPDYDQTENLETPEVSVVGDRPESFTEEPFTEEPFTEEPFTEEPFTEFIEPQPHQRIIPIERPPMVAQPAQFLGTSVEDGDLEADEISAVLEDIDQELRLEQSDLDDLEAPGIEGVLANYSASYSANYPISHTINRTSTSRTSQPANESTIQAAVPEKDDPTASPDLIQTAPKAAAQSIKPSAIGQPGNLQPSPQQTRANTAFQALKLKDHFWNRLSTLTHDSHKEAAKIAQSMKAAGVNRSQSSLLAAAAGLDKEEIVIYDEMAATTQPTVQPTVQPVIQPTVQPVVQSTVQPVVQSTVQSTVQPNYAQPNYAQPNYVKPTIERTTQPRGSARVQPTVQPNSQPLSRRRSHRLSNQSATALTRATPDFSQPSGTVQTTQGVPQQAIARQTAASADLPEMALPVISVPMGDLIAGEIITVTVRTRPSMYKPFIKLWMVDRQSRSLVIEPQLLTSLRPDALGDLEATLEMQVPMDCLDVQIAAIAIDMATQQESNKAIVNRHVVPANQTSLSTRRFSL